MKKLLTKPLYPREPNFKNVSCEVSKKTKHLRKNNISLDEINTEVLLILQKDPNADNFKIISDYGSLTLQYDLVIPISETKRKEYKIFNEKLTEKYENAILEYEKKLENYKIALEKELESLIKKK